MNVTPSLIFVNSCHWLQMCTVRVRNAHDILECVNNNLKINPIFCSGRTLKQFLESTHAHTCEMCLLTIPLVFLHITMIVLERDNL